ncbi:S9 family peptidase [Janthinobacterium sp. 61]|uniref:alpha/beta hydrolase family protein n=1 Tax=Janthinobacterium sp. 61 TaxID=2035209 RepID=UPI00214CD86B|nr:prolyl oligopeptidase family serine peptidase [Janthinobacterium sp. 61]
MWHRAFHKVRTAQQRGYAVLPVNYRGATGFGTQFISAGDLQWGRTMHDDLLDAVQWAVTSDVTSADKAAIMGGSHGGYATLAGMAFTPTTFACGVDIVGPSNLFTLLKPSRLTGKRASSSFTSAWATRPRKKARRC